MLQARIKVFCEGAERHDLRALGRSFAAASAPIESAAPEDVVAAHASVGPVGPPHRQTIGADAAAAGDGDEVGTGTKQRALGHSVSRLKGCRKKQLDIHLNFKSHSRLYRYKNSRSCRRGDEFVGNF